MPSYIPAPLPLTIPDVSTLDAAAVRNNHALLTSLIQEANPDVDVKQGTLYNLLFYLSAVLTTCNQVVAKQIQQSISLAAISANPTLAIDSVVNNFLSNFNITRNQGSNASGPLLIVLSIPLVVTIPKGSVFTIGTQTFVADDTYTSRVSQASILNTTDRLITQLGQNLYGFTINVVAQSPGVAGNVSRGTRAVPAILPSAVFMQAFTAADFTNGADTETNAQLIARLPAGAGLKAWSNRMTIDAMIRNQLAFSQISGTSLIGFGDVEMLRDKHSLWPGSTGGRADLYVRTQGRVGSIILNKTATFISASSAGGVWQFSLGKDEVPGFFEIDSITQPGNIGLLPSYTVQADIRGFDLSNTTQAVPDIVVVKEAQYSRFATGTFQFLDTNTPTTGLVPNTSTKQYDVAVRYMPLIAQIQDFLLQRSVAAPTGDVLVKAPIPIFVTVSCTVELKPGMPSPSTSAIQEAIAAATNRLGFGAKLTAAVLASAVASALPAGAVLTQILMTGRLRNPDNSVTIFSGTDSLVPAVDPTKPMTSIRTTAYFLSPNDVTVTVVTTTDPQV
jgi:hypothetical protein